MFEELEEGWDGMKKEEKKKKIHPRATKDGKRQQNQFGTITGPIRRLLIRSK